MPVRRLMAVWKIELTDINDAGTRHRLRMRVVPPGVRLARLLDVGLNLAEDCLGGISGAVERLRFIKLVGDIQLQ
jgi:hypothetical protein